MRCLTLADVLRGRGCTCRFVCRQHAGGLDRLIRERGYPVDVLPSVDAFASASPADQPIHASWLEADWQTDADQTRQVLAGAGADWLIVDHYALGERWEQRMRDAVARIMVIDDLADRPHACDLLLDQNMVESMEERYTGKIPANCGLLLGPHYALLQSAYAEMHDRTPARMGPIRNILVFFGGADTKNLTGRVISAFVSLRRADVRLNVVVGSINRHIDALRQSASGQENIVLHTHVPTLAPLMAEADLAVGACGVTAWERCCLGLPALVVTIADNQQPIAAELQRRGLIRWLGSEEVVDERKLAHALEAVLAEGLPSAEWSQWCKEAVDGQGARRVASLLLLDSSTLLFPRLAEPYDEQTVLRWANDPLVRLNAFNPSRIDANAHRHWFSARLSDTENCRFYIVETVDGLQIGQVRFQRADDRWEIHYALDARCRGRGLGAPLLASAIDTLRSAIGENEVFGRVKPDNRASRRVFEKLGFSEKQCGDQIEYRLIGRIA